MIPLIPKAALLIAALATYATAAEIHRYEIDGSFADALGGPSLVANGSAGAGALGASGYSFLANQGLSLSNALPANDHYSILIDFEFANLAEYRKILDFRNLVPDDGLYVLNSNLEFYPSASSTGEPFQPNVLSRVVLTRDGGSDLVTGYVNGVQKLAFTDTLGISVFSAPDNVMRFFNDDAETDFGEASAGFVDRIVVYDSPLTAGEVAALGVPEPESAALIGVGVAAFSARRRRRN